MKIKIGRYDLFPLCVTSLAVLPPAKKEEILKEALSDAVRNEKPKTIECLLPHMSLEVVRHVALEAPQGSFNNVIYSYKEVFLKDDDLCLIAMLSVIALGKSDSHEKASFLLPMMSKEMCNDALVKCVLFGNFEMLKLCITFVDPKTEESLALQEASKRKSQKMFDFLCPLSDPRTALKSLFEKGEKGFRTEILEHYVNILDSHEELTTKTKSLGKKIFKKKM